MGAFFQELTPEIKVTVAENSERHSMTRTYIHKLNLRVNMSYNINTIFACCQSVILSVNCVLLTHDHYANSMLYKWTTR